MTKENNPIKAPSFRIAHCGTFPNYHLGKLFLNEKNIIYLVSVGKEKFEKKWVERFVNFIKEIKPKKTIIVVADSLQRFNIEVDENMSEIAALQESKNRGEKWVEKYKSYFSTPEINYEFTHWDTLKEDVDFEQYLGEIISLSTQHTEFKEALLDSSKEYTERPSRINSNHVSDQKKAESKSCDFLQEECAVFQILAKEKDNIAIVYPGAATKVLAFSIAHINKNYRADNSFYWLHMRATKERKKNKKLDVQLSNNIELDNKECKTIKNHFKVKFFRRFSLDESQSFNIQTSKNKENDLNPSPFFRRPSLDANAYNQVLKHYII
ncbi:hypothetical protein [Rickettsiella endosymbiont of Aleochara curtula]|uniref:hypothetical protein n=1 Tax=Rickettsiella endosymbiont of Aleochara curtula TaxID=3077936 RepID=UPI00313AC9CD